MRGKAANCAVANDEIIGDGTRRSGGIGSNNTARGERRSEKRRRQQRQIMIRTVEVPRGEVDDGQTHVDLKSWDLIEL